MFCSVCLGDWKYGVYFHFSLYKRLEVWCIELHYMKGMRNGKPPEIIIMTQKV